MKQGKRLNYTGGSVWKTREEAEKHCPTGYSVYGVILDWERDSEPSHGTWNNLLYDRPLEKLMSKKPFSKGTTNDESSSEHTDKDS